jgi:D-sedoheptulose 7-phosphate isomerase
VKFKVVKSTKYAVSGMSKLFFIFEHMKPIIESNLKEAREVLEEFMTQPDQIESIEAAARILIDTVKSGKKIISCGNGGSMTDAMHFAEELSGVFREKRKALPAISVSDPSHITCTANDFGFETVFSRYVEAVGQNGDTLLVISTSGNSMNLIKAVEAAREKKMHVLGLTGKSGGLLAGMVDKEIRVKGRRHSDRIQEMHIKILHILVLLIERGVQK